MIEGLRISDSGINVVEFFFSIFWVNEISYGLFLTISVMSTN